ncbi:hypothetical protein ACRHQN_27600 [Burkholderia pseudomallei]|uniref:hypothetical protein n=1 Tax=Burkholderia pseudomallei TaxID=28450 RepID=UPI0040629959
MNQQDITLSKTASLEGLHYENLHSHIAPDKRRTMKEMREKIHNLQMQIWYNWNYLTLRSMIEEGEVNVVSTVEYNAITYPDNLNYISDEKWAVLQAGARELEEEFGLELIAIPDELDLSFLEGKLSALKYACGWEWEHLYA